MNTMPFEKFKEIWQRQIMANPDLASGTKLIAWAISTHINRNSRVAWPGMIRLTAMVAGSRSTTKRAIKDLEAGGHFKVMRSRSAANHNNTNRYELTLKRFGNGRVTGGAEMDPPRSVGGPRVGPPMDPKPLTEPLNQPLPYGGDLRSPPPKNPTEKRQEPENHRPASTTSCLEEKGSSEKEASSRPESPLPASLSSLVRPSSKPNLEA
jgi:hypothetical protein